MGIPVLILGESGSGKSTSLRNFSKDDVGVINVASKPLPFRSEIKPYNLNREAKKQGKDRYQLLYKVLKGSKVRSVAIDDSQYLMAFDSFEKAKGVSMNTTYKGQIAENDEVDYFKFTVSSTGLVKLDATSYMPSVTYYIYDSGNNKLAIWPSVWDSVTKVATLSKTHLLTAGTYYLVVDKTVGSTGNYNFKLS